MIYNSWTVQPNILLRLSSVPHGCWGCIAPFFGFLRICNVKLCPWTPAGETRIPFETDPAGEARPMREAMHAPETGYANKEWTTRTCEAGPSCASGRTREVDTEFEWLEDLAEHLKTMGKAEMLRDLLARDDKNPRLLF